jgi:peptidoglycan DL-endopeptidase CwlO
VASAVALTSGLVAPLASAASLSDLRAQAAALVSRINSLGQQEEALSEKYDNAQLQVQQLQLRVQQAAAQLTAAQATTNRAKQALMADAVNAYVNGGSSPLQSGGNAIQNANTSLLRAEYVNTLATNQNDAIDQYHLATLQEQAAEISLKHQTAAAQRQLQQVASARTAVSNLQSQLNATYQQDTGQIAQLVAQQEAADAAAAQRAAEQRLAAAQAAAANAHTVSFGPVPAVGSGAAGAVRAAESQVGTPYAWGGTSPSTGFDCSGLIMWAYEQVGVSLPHFSGAQYNDTTHIPMSDLQPGDLVFPQDPGEHVAMYVGNGEIVEAPHTGATVHIVPMSSWFVLASRVE